MSTEATRLKALRDRTGAGFADLRAERHLVVRARLLELLHAEVPGLVVQAVDLLP